MASDKSSWDSTKDTAAQKADETKNVGGEKTEQAKEQAHGATEATKQKASEGASTAQQKADEAKQGTAQAGETAKQKATEAKDSAANTLQQAGDKVKETLTSAKDAITGANQTEAREVEKSKIIKLGFAIDGRERLVPPLPVNYFGNVNFYGCAQTNADDLVSQPLPHAAACIQEAKMRVDDEYMRSALDWVESQSSPLNIFPSFNSFCGLDLALTSWSRFPAYEVDFGWGCPGFFGIPVAAWDGLVIFLPSQHGPNSVNLLIGLTEQHMNNLINNPSFLSSLSKPI